MALSQKANISRAAGDGYCWPESDLYKCHTPDSNILGTTGEGEVRIKLEKQKMKTFYNINQLIYCYTVYSACYIMYIMLNEFIVL